MIVPAQPFRHGYEMVAEGSYLLEGDGVGEGADFFDFDGYRIAGLEPHGRLSGHADAVRGACENHGAR